MAVQSWNGEWVLWEITEETKTAGFFTSKTSQYVILPGSKEHLHRRIDKRKLAYLLNLHLWKQANPTAPVSEYVSQNPMTGLDIEEDYQIICGILQELPDAFSYSYCDAIACDKKKYQLELTLARFM